MMIKIQTIVTLLICLAFMLLGIISPLKPGNQISKKKRQSKEDTSLLLNLHPKQLLSDWTNSTLRIGKIINGQWPLSENLITLGCAIKYRIFHTSPVPDKVVAGSHDWLFLGNDHGNVLMEYMGLDRFKEEQLDTIAMNVQRCYDYCEKQHIRFYLAIAPNKHTVYGNYLPLIKSRDPDKLNQVVLRLQKENIRVIDLKTDFDRVADTLLFYRTDSHWNDYGLFLAYRTMMNTLKSDFNDLVILGYQNFHIDTLSGYKGGSSRMMSYVTQSEETYRFMPQYTSTANKMPTQYKAPPFFNHRPGLFEQRYAIRGGKRKILVFHDSFFEDMPFFVKESFGSTVFIFSGPDRSIIEKEKPDIVIVEKIEREIDFLLSPML